MRARLTLLLLLCGLAVQFSAVVHAADVVFDNGASSREDGWEMTEWFEADDFVVGNRTLLSGVKFWNYASTGAFTGSITWEIYTNSANGPGQLVASGASTPSSHTPTGYVMFGLHEAVTTFDILPVLLDPGTYWLALHNGPREYTKRGMFWAPTANTASSGAPSYGRGSLSSGPWHSNVFPGFPPDLAFQVLGNVVATPPPTPIPTATPALTPTPTPTAQPSPSPSATPPPPQRQLLNIATRLRVQTGENVLIGGLIVTGNGKKKVIIRGIGPSLAAQGINGVLPDPMLELYQGDGVLATNDDWKDSQRQEIEQSRVPPSDDRESAIVYTLDPGPYTAVMSGRNGTTGIGVIEVYDLDQEAESKLANIATRGFVETGDNVMIGGLIVGGEGTADARILLRAIGPSLAQAGVANALQDPVMELFDHQGNLVRENDDWEDTQRAAIEATGIAPKHRDESAILVDLKAGNYTAVVRGINGVGIGIVEVYNLR